MDAEIRIALILLAVGGLGGFIFGYTTGVIAGALIAMENTFPSLASSSLEQGVVTTSILLGALIGSAFGSSIAEAFNKRRTVFLSGILVILGSAASALLPRLGMILLAREVLGVGVGIISVVCPLYVSELAPARFRGALGSWFQVALTFGILIAYLVNLAFANVIYDFRWMFGLGVLPGILLCLTFFVMPPAPSDMQEPTASFDKYQRTKPSGVRLYWSLVREHPWTLCLSVVLAISLQLTGINAVLYYAPTIFANAGFSGSTSSLLASLGVGAWNFLSTFVAIFLVDRVGRRPLLLVGLSVMMVAVTILGFVFQFLINDSPTLSGVLSIVLLFVYIMGFEAGIGSLFWPLLTETYPPDYRDAGASIGNVLQWSFNICLSALFPLLLEVFSQGIVFWGFGVISVLCLVFLFFKLPETSAVVDTVSTSDLDADIQTKKSVDENIYTDNEAW